MSYVIVVNARNEEKFIGGCLRSLITQSLEPAAVILVDDGSTDGTIDIARSLGVEVLEPNNQRYKARGINQSLAFNAGVEYSKRYSWEYLLKMDADSIIPPDYAARLIEKMRQHETLGVCGGVPTDSSIRLARVTDGARLIRRRCWEDIGGYTPTTGFDTHALLKAKSRGWDTVTFDEVKYVELRTSRKYGLKRWYDTGVARKRWGFTLPHTVLASLKNSLTGSPPVLNALVMILAFALSRPEPDRFLDRDWVRQYSRMEIREFMGVLIEKLT